MFSGTRLSKVAGGSGTTGAVRAWLFCRSPISNRGRLGRGFARLRARYQGGTGPLPRSLVEAAERLFTDLLASAAPSVVLHGDLHHGNILAAQRAPWLAIDPKGIIGEPAYEAGALLRNPMPEIARHPALDRVLWRRVDHLADMLNLERERVRGWGVAQAVLSAWWSIEDLGFGWEPAIACAEALLTQPGEKSRRA